MANYCYRWPCHACKSRKVRGQKQNILKIEEQPQIRADAQQEPEFSSARSSLAMDLQGKIIIDEGGERNQEYELPPPEGIEKHARRKDEPDAASGRQQPKAQHDKHQENDITQCVEEHERRYS